jgi:hypothetical protein
MQPNGPQQLPQVPPGQYPYQGQAPLGQVPTPVGKPKKHSHLVWIVSLVLTVLLFLGALGFGIWAFSERDTYKNKTDAVVAKEVELAVQKNTSEKEKEFVEREKNPFKKYDGPAQFGSVSITYPKTWAAFVTEKATGSSPVDGYMHPGFVPGTDSGTAFALRIEVVDRAYDLELKNLESKVKQGTLTVAPYRAPKVPEVLGARVDGEINKGQKDSMVMFPIRDKTLKITTQSETFLKDFNDIILKELVFVP